jgi:hypothetical protein
MYYASISTKASAPTFYVTLCDTKADDEVVMTGPSGKVMLLPEDKTHH